MAGMMFEQLAPGLAQVTTTGTHVIEGQPMSWRTHKAINHAGFDATRHRSHQMTDADIRAADLVVAMAAEHVAYVRRQHAHAAGRTATLKRLVKELNGTSGLLAPRLESLALADIVLEPWEDVVDPAGGQLPEFEACAEEIRELVVGLVAVLSD